MIYIPCKESLRCSWKKNEKIRLEALTKFTVTAILNMGLFTEKKLMGSEEVYSAKSPKNGSERTYNEYMGKSYENYSEPFLASIIIA